MNRRRPRASTWTTRSRILGNRCFLLGVYSAARACVILAFTAPVLSTASFARLTRIAGAYWQDTGRTYLYIVMCGHCGGGIHHPSTCWSAAFPARTFLLAGVGPASQNQPDRDYGRNMQDLLVKSGHGTQSSKTSRDCSPKEWKSSYQTFPPLGTMRTGRVCPLPRSELLTCAKGCLSLPTPTGTGVVESIGYYLRSRNTWENESSLGACLIGLEYGLRGRHARPSGRHIVDVSFVEWMMGAPKGWTEPTGASLACPLLSRT